MCSPECKYFPLLLRRDVGRNGQTPGKGQAPLTSGQSDVDGAHVAPFRGTGGGLAFANEYFCANVEIGGLSVVIMLSPIRTLPNVEIVLGHRSQQVQSFNPRRVVKAVFPVPYEGGGKLDIEDETIVVIKSSGAVVGSFRLSPLIFDFDF